MQRTACSRKGLKRRVGRRQPSAEFCQSLGLQVFVPGFVWNVAAPVGGRQPQVEDGAVAAERRPEHGRDINLVVERVIPAGLCSRHHEAFGDIVVVDAVLVHHAFDARLHPVPASLVERCCLWDGVGQGEGRHLVGSVEAVGAW